ncbi:MAG: RNA methyltransferase, partial [Muribaculaceae bacterium]|nr:RNA methyltransferase [Muribaculaceae bacterium]
SVHRVDLPKLVSTLAEENVEICGTFMQGDDILHSPLPSQGAMLILGNEGNGISQQVETAVTRRLTIPSYAPADHVESLNVATACAICLAMFRRNSSL